MNTTTHTEVNRRRTLVAPTVAFILVVACAVMPIRTEGVAAAQTPPVADAKHADHGLVLTIGDVLFPSGRADLKPAAIGSLNKLVTFLTQFPGHNVAIHGYTDSVGSEEYNQGLSERRANSVKAYLAAQGIGSTRLSTLGMGQSAPVAGNDSGVGRQQNRRVEVIISNPPANPPAVLTPRARTTRMLALLALLESLSGTRPLF